MPRDENMPISPVLGIPSRGVNNVAILRSPYRVPISQDHALAARLPDSWKMGWFNGRHGAQSWEALRRFRRMWGRNRWFPMHELDLELGGSHVDTYPVASAERVQWFEPFRCVGITPLSTVPRVFELLRVQAVDFATTVLERIATYLLAQGLDATGAPVGPPFVTNACSDPCAFPLVHPEGVVVGNLNVRWRLVADPNPPDREGAPPVMLVAAPPEMVPVGYPIFGIPPVWPDLRFTWGGTYTVDNYSLIMGNVLLRMFIEISTPAPTRWRVQAGGLLGGFTQNTGPLCAALRAAIERRP